MMTELTREQVEKIVTKLDSVYVWKHELQYLLVTDAALRARLEGVEKERDEWKLSLLASAAEPIGDILKPPDEYRAGICEGRTNKQAQLATAQARVEFSKQGKCLKCNAGPMRESCAYPEACEHPGVKLALAYNQSLLTTAQLNGQLLTAQARVRELEESNNNSLNVIHGQNDITRTLTARLTQVEEALKEQRRQMDFPGLPEAFSLTMKRMIDQALHPSREEQGT